MGKWEGGKEPLVASRARGHARASETERSCERGRACVHRGMVRPIRMQQSVLPLLMYNTWFHACNMT